MPSIQRITTLSYLAMGLTVLITMADNIASLNPDTIGMNLSPRARKACTWPLMVFSGAVNMCHIVNYHRVGREFVDAVENQNRCVMVGGAVGSVIWGYLLWR